MRKHGMTLQTSQQDSTSSLQPSFFFPSEGVKSRGILNIPPLLLDEQFAVDAVDMQNTGVFRFTFGLFGTFWDSSRISLE